MKLQEIKHQNEEQILQEATQEQSIFWTSLTGAGLGGVLVTSFIIGSGVTAPTLFAGGFFYLVVGIFTAIAAGISTLFVRGEKRDLYEEIKERSERLIENLNKYEVEYKNAKTEEEKQEVLEEGLKELTSDLQQIDILQSRLEELIRQDEGSAGLFRRSFQRMLSRRLRKGEDLQGVIKKVRKEVDKMKEEKPLSL